MAGIRIEVNTAQLDDLLERLKTAPAAIQQQAQAEIEAESKDLTERIRARWPVDTGFSKPLWRAIQINVWQWLVTNSAYYAEWVFAKGDRSRTPLLYTWIATEIARSRATLLVNLRALILAAIRNPSSRVARGARIRLGSSA